MSRLCVFTCLLAALGCRSAPTALQLPPSGGLLQQLDVAYVAPSDGGAGFDLLDLTWIDDGEPKRPVVLVHGGSWVSGDKDNFRESAPDLVQWFADRGFLVVAPNFRLAAPPGQQGAGPVEQAGDLAQVLGWVAEHGADYGATTVRPVLFGFSSGAHLVALLGADERYVTDVGLQPDHIAATVSMDVHAYDVPLALELMQDSVVEDNIPLIEHLFGPTRSDQLQASPIHYIDGHVADALLVSAEPDPQVPGTHGWIASEASGHYADALTQAGHHAESVHFSDKTHSGLVMGFGGDDGPTQAVRAFLDDAGL